MTTSDGGKPDYSEMRRSEAQEPMEWIIYVEENDGEGEAVPKEDYTSRDPIVENILVIERRAYDQVLAENAKLKDDNFDCWQCREAIDEQAQKNSRHEAFKTERLNQQLTAANLRIAELTADRDRWYEEFAKLEISRASCCSEMEAHRDLLLDDNMKMAIEAGNMRVKLEKCRVALERISQFFITNDRGRFGQFIGAGAVDIAREALKDIGGG